MARPNLEKASVFAGVALIAAATLWPFTFVPRRPSWLEYVGSFRLEPTTLLDAPRNIVLFMPFGCALASRLGRGRRSGLQVLGTTAAAGLLLSGAVETLQIFLPGRTANVTDVMANTLGALAGAGALLVCRRQHRAPRLPVWRRAADMRMFYAAHSVFILCVVWTVMRGVLPDSWQSRSHLVLGSEWWDETRWNGGVTDVVVLDRAVGRTAAATLLAGAIPREFGDAVVATGGHGSANAVIGDEREIAAPIPRLSVSDAPHFRFNRRTAVFTATDLAERVHAIHQFTVAATIATYDVRQSEPAPILAIARDARHADLSLAQDSRHLVVRWRSPLTSWNHMAPDVRFPGVFRSSSPQRIVVCFDGSTARLRSTDDAVDDDVAVRPDAVLAAMTFETSLWPVAAARRQRDFLRSAVPLVAVTFLPLGAAMGAVRHPRCLTALAVFAPAPAFESLVAAYQNVAVRFEAVGLGLFLTLVGFTATRLGTAHIREQPARQSDREADSDDLSPYIRLFFISVGLLLIPAWSVLSRDRAAGWTVLPFFLFVLTAIRVVALMCRRVFPFPERVQQTWARRRELARQFDSYQWQKLLWIGLGLSAYVLISADRSRHTLAAATLCLLCGAPALICWRRRAGLERLRCTRSMRSESRA